MTEPKYENLFIFCADALRREYHPELPGTTVTVATAGGGTPTAIPTLVTGRNPNEHRNVWFWNSQIQVPSIFDLEQEGYDVAYFDHPADRMFDVLRYPPFKFLEDMEPPFVYFERDLHTHTPYGVSWIDLYEEGQLDEIGPRPDPREARAYPEGFGTEYWEDGNEYIEHMMSGDAPFDWKADYEQAVERCVSRFGHHLSTLNKMDVLEDTLVIFTADHGEAWGGPIGHDDCSHAIHNTPTCNQVMFVECTFYDRNLGVAGDRQALPQREVLSAWDERWLGGRDDLEMVDREDTDRRDDLRDEEAAKDRLRDLGYLE